MDKTLKARVLAVLKAVEFSGVRYDEDEGYDGEYDYWEERCCPVCDSITEGEHYDDCELAKLIKELSKEDDE